MILGRRLGWAGFGVADGPAELEKIAQLLVVV